MQEKKKQYILDDLLRIILAMFVLTVLFAFSCLLLSHGARGIWLAVLAQFTLLGVLGGVFLRRCLRIVQKNEQVMQLYAAGYTIADICHLKCYFSRGTDRDRCSLGSADTDGKTADRADLRQRSWNGAGNTSPASERAVPNSL